MRETLLSVGIDVGTTTSHVVFSRIAIDDLSGGFTVPRIEIVGKEVFYYGKVHFTPLLSPTRIDAGALRELVATEYERAGIRPEDVDTGAVIITGETARKDNADEVLHAMASFAGDFVVATAGPALESVIAARGAGIDELSKQRGIRAANIDVGGGTSNIAVFAGGELESASCLDIGGRLLRVSDRSVAYIAEKLALLAAAEGIDVRVGERADLPKLKRLADAMVRVLEMSVGLVPATDSYFAMLTEPATPPGAIQALSISGGVADLLGQPLGGQDPFPFGDVGLLLAEAIDRSQLFSQVERISPKQTIRATVVGAGMHLTELSGSTIEYDPTVLPLKNLSVVRISEAEQADDEALIAAVQTKLALYAPNVAGSSNTPGPRPGSSPGTGSASMPVNSQPVAISFPGYSNPTFEQVQQLAGALIAATEQLRADGNPLVAVVEEDMAKALGQAIRASLREGFVSIDGVHAKDGDYIDIGKPTAAGVLPVAVKTLVFEKNGEES
ncbi:MAG: ethanolamine ammonia-lyase reactivating factor EutA [Propionibacteriaceae bacterium]|nr:ethanolamine ammonia-lyase reactivating factor EutA [Propionibacteriaceae bacterium]